MVRLEKSTLAPSKQVPYLGFVSDSQKQAFTLLPHKKQKFIALIKQALNSTTLDLITLQRLIRKCMSLALAEPGSRLYSNEINLAISRATRSARPIAVSNCLRQELYRIGSSSKRGVVFFPSVPSDTPTLSSTPIHHRMHGKVS